MLDGHTGMSTDAEAAPTHDFVTYSTEMFQPKVKRKAKHFDSMDVNWGSLDAVWRPPQRGL